MAGEVAVARQLHPDRRSGGDRPQEVDLLAEGEDRVVERVPLTVGDGAGEAVGADGSQVGIHERAAAGRTSAVMALVLQIGIRTFSSLSSPPVGWYE